MTVATKIVSPKKISIKKSAKKVSKKSAGSRKAMKFGRGPASILFILDRSGSMGSLKSDVIGGYNRFLEDQKKEKGEALLTTVQFDSKDPFEVLGADVPIAMAGSVRFFV